MIAAISISIVLLMAGFIICLLCCIILYVMPRTADPKDERGRLPNAMIEHLSLSDATRSDDRSPTRQARCYECGASVRADRLAGHRKRVHRNLVHCQRCNLYIRRDRIVLHNQKHHAAECDEILPALKVNCPVCSDEVNCRRALKHLQRVHGNDGYRTYKPLEGIRYTDWKNLVLIDGTSIMGQPTRLEPLLALSYGLAKRELPFLVLVDEQAAQRLHNNEVRPYHAIWRKLMQRRSEFVVRGPIAQTRTTILKIADWIGASVISNRDFTSREERFPWLAQKERLWRYELDAHAVHVGSQKLEIEAMSIGPLQKALSNELRRLARKQARL